MKPASASNSGKKSRGYALRIAFKRSQNAVGQITVEHISILEDLWHDYLFFKGQVQKTEGLEQKRYLRASLLVFMAYLEGVVNYWCQNLLMENGKSKTEITDFLFTNKIYDKIAVLAEYAAKTDSAVRDPVVDIAKRLRNRLSHFRTGKDIEVFDGLTYDLLMDTEQSVSEWLAVMETALGEKRQPNTQDLAKPILEINPDATTDYSGSPK